MTGEALRYRAFISYSHRDSKLAQKLHRRLETYAIPRALRGVNSDGSTIAKRLGAVFRDRDELAAAANLSRSIEEALDASSALIVVCSPAAVASLFVDAEIAYFRRNHPDRPTLAFIVDGDPAADVSVCRRDRRHRRRGLGADRAQPHRQSGPRVGPENERVN